MSKAKNPVVATAQGAVGGVEMADGTRVFRGIPYASPPVGERRLQRCLPHPPWQDVLDCSAYRACSLQTLAPEISLAAAYPGGLDESCLHLNVWTPPGVGKSSGLPVYVWIHGGAFVVGSGSEPIYQGARLTRENVVVVTVNYRLGALGFMWSDGGDANCALWDQVRVLEWVQENIDAFGGDRNSVTIGGESAGAGCVTCLVASPVANKLFHRAIIMSAVAHTTDDERTARIRAAQFARALGAESSSAVEFRKFTADEVLAAQSGQLDRAPEQDVVVGHNTPGWQGPTLDQLHTEYHAAEPDGIHYVVPGDEREHPFAHGFFPAVDGELLPVHPLDAIANGDAAHITLLVGSNREETAFRENPADPETTAALTYGARVGSVEDAVRRAHWFFMGWGGLESLGGPERVAEGLVHAYADAEQNGSGAASRGSVQHVWNRLASDLSFNASTVMVAARQARRNPVGVFSYRFDGFNNRNAFHGWELGLVFGTMLNEDNPETVRFADVMRDAFTEFMKTGSPGWPAWSSADGLNGPVMRFDRSASTLSGYLTAAPEIGRVIQVLDDAFFHSSTTL